MNTWYVEAVLMFDDGEQYHAAATVVASNEHHALAEAVRSIGFDPGYLDMEEYLWVIEARIIPEALLLEKSGERMLPGFERIAQMELGLA